MANRPTASARTRATLASAGRSRYAARRGARENAKSPYASFRRDHAGVLARLDSLEAALPRVRAQALRPEPLRALIAHLERQFATHMAAEEAVLYPVLERAFPEAGASLRPLHQEHAELRALLAALAVTLAQPANRARDERVVVQVRDFTDLLRLHIRKEESFVFDLSERVLNARELRGLARRLVPFLPANSPRPRPRRLTRSRPS